MDIEQILAKLKDVLHEHLDIDVNNINGDTRVQDMGIDSLHLVDLILEIESEMGSRIDYLNLPKNPSLNDLCEAIGRNMKRD